MPDFEAAETARLAARERNQLALIASRTAALLRCFLEHDVDQGRRLHRAGVMCPSCGTLGTAGNPHYIVTTIGFWAELRCADHGCRHRWEHNTKEPA